MIINKKKINKRSSDRRKGFASKLDYNNFINHFGVQGTEAVNKQVGETTTKSTMNIN